MNLSRKLKRNKEKVAYKKFSIVWNKERKLQRKELKTLTDKQKKNYRNPILGIKPTFKHWVSIVKTARAHDSSPSEVQEFKDDIDLNWEE